MIEKAPNVTVQNPVHFLPRDRDVQRIQRLMLATLWPEAVRETPKILFINLVEDRDHSLLNNLVLQGRDPERPLPTIRFRYENSSRRLRSISATVDPTVQIGEPTFQPSLILFPCDAVRTRRGLPSSPSAGGSPLLFE